jgi:hypothetical protein
MAIVDRLSDLVNTYNVIISELMEIEDLQERGRLLVLINFIGDYIEAQGDRKIFFGEPR